MGITNGDGKRPAIYVRIDDNELCFGQVVFCKDYVRDVDIAIHRLLQGKKIKLLQSAPLVNAVQRQVEDDLSQIERRSPAIKQAAKASPTVSSLTEREVATFRFVSDYIARNGYSPTMREIVDADIASSTSVASYALDELEGQGFLTRQDFISRSIVLTDKGKLECIRLQKDAA